MKRKVILIPVVVLLLIFCLPVYAHAEPIDKDANPVPVVSSGSFVCETWIDTSLDSFNVKGAGVTLTGASWSFDRGYVMYKLTGTFKSGFTISLDVSGTMGKMGYAMEHRGNDLNMHLKCYDKYGKELEALSQVVNISDSASASLSDTVSLQIPDYVDEVELYGSFTCGWSTPNSSAKELVGVKAILKSETGAAEVPEPTAPAAAAVPSESGSWWGGADEKPEYYPTYNPTYKPAYIENAIVRFGDLHGEVNVRPAGSDEDDWIFVDINTPLKHGDIIRTLPKSGAILSFSDMSTYVMKEDTIIVLDLENERDTKIGIIAGTVWANLKKMVKDGSMEVEMGQAVAGIKGTTFICEEKDGVSTLKVIEGTVAYTSKADGETIMVSDGKMIGASADGLGKLTTFDIDAELETWDEDVRQMTADALSGGKSGLKLGGIIIIAVVLLLGGAVVIIILKNKQKKAIQPFAPAYPQMQAYGTQSQIPPSQKAAPRFCMNCGNPIVAGSKFCSRCGHKTE